jgi:hypothetical protein
MVLKLFFDGMINGKEYFNSIHLQIIFGAPSILLDSDPYPWILEGYLIAIKQPGEST